MAFGGNKNNEFGTKQKTSSVTSIMLKKDKSSKKEDVDAFLKDATELIKVIQKYAATIERDRASSSADSTTESGETEKLISMMESMGMTSALSKKQYGSAYHKLIARQLVDYLRQSKQLANSGGMMTLTDAYCLFNRARGTNLISPEDLLKALDLMKELNLGISKRSFASGVVVIQDDKFDDELMGKKLAELASSSMLRRRRNDSDTTEESVGGITATDVCRALKTTALLANEHLLSAEQSGWLCRDTTIEGVRFFPNLFDSGDFSLCLPSAKVSSFVE